MLVHHGKLLVFYSLQMKNLKMKKYFLRLTLTTSLSSTIKNDLTGSTTPTNDALQQAIMALYHANNIKVLISVFGATDQGITGTENPTTLATTIANFVTTNNLDGVDVDWEDTFPTNYFDVSGTGEEWLVLLFTQLRSLLPSPTYLITSLEQKQKHI